MPPEITALLEKYLSSAVLLSGAIYFWKRGDTLRDKNATLEAKTSSLEDRNKELKWDLQKEIDRLKAENITLQKTLQEKFSDEAILAKYDVNNIVAIHKTSHAEYCPGCLQNTPRNEVKLLFNNDSAWLCPVEKKYYSKSDRGQRHSSGSEWHPFEQ